jgi:hypothetical protein
MHVTSWAVSRNILLDHERSFEWTLYCYWNQTKLIQLWNVILDAYQSRDKNFIKRIIPFTWPAQLHMNRQNRPLVNRNNATSTQQTMHQTFLSFMWPHLSLFIPMCLPGTDARRRTLGKDEI